MPRLVTTTRSQASASSAKPAPRWEELGRVPVVSSSGQPAQAPGTMPRLAPQNTVGSRGPPSALYNRSGKSQVGRQPSVLAPVHEMAKMSFNDNNPPHGTAQSNAMSRLNQYTSPSIAPVASNQNYNVRETTKTQMSMNWRNPTDVPEDMKSDDYTGALTGFTHVERTANTMLDFQYGWVIRISHHEPNTNPNNGPTDPHVARTCVGPVFSKPRMFAVMWIREENLVALPLYTWHFKGLSTRVRKGKDTRNEYACMSNYGSPNPSNEHPRHRLIEFIARPGEAPIHPKSCIHLTGLTKIDIGLPFDYVGRITRSSYNYLITLLDDLNSNESDMAKAKW